MVFMISTNSHWPRSADNGSFALREVRAHAPETETIMADLRCLNWCIKVLSSHDLKSYEKYLLCFGPWSYCCLLFCCFQMRTHTLLVAIAITVWVLRRHPTRRQIIKPNSCKGRWANSLMGAHSIPANVFISIHSKTKRYLYSNHSFTLPYGHGELRTSDINLHFVWCFLERFISEKLKKCLRVSTSRARLIRWLVTSGGLCRDT